MARPRFEMTFSSLSILSIRASVSFEVPIKQATSAFDSLIFIGHFDSSRYFTERIRIFNSNLSFTVVLANSDTVFTQTVNSWLRNFSSVLDSENEELSMDRKSRLGINTT